MRAERVFSDPLQPRRLIRYPCSRSTDLPSGPGATSRNPAQPIKRILTPDEMTALCGVNPLNFPIRHGDVGGRKAVDIVEYPQSTVLKGKQAIKEWGRPRIHVDKEQANSEMVGEVVGRVLARHICSDENLIITEAYGCDLGERGCVLITNFLEDFEESTISNLSDSMNDDLRAKLTGFLNVARLEQFDVKGLLFGEIEHVKKFGLLDLEDVKWNESVDIYKGRPLDQVLDFLSVSANDKSTFNLKVKEHCSNWLANMKDTNFCELLKKECEIEAGITSEQADDFVSNLVYSAGKYAKEISL